MPTVPPPAPSIVVYTGSIGPGNTLTTQTISNVKSVRFLMDIGILEVETYDSNRRFVELRLDGLSTVTVSIANSVATFTCS